MEKYYTVVYKYNGVCNEMIKGLMASELMRVYHTYANMCNNGVTEQLNLEFKSQNPNYFKENEGKEWYDLKEYNQFIADGYNKRVCDVLNKRIASPVLEFFTNSDELQFMGRLRFNKNATIEFFMKEA